MAEPQQPQAQTQAQQGEGLGLYPVLFFGFGIAAGILIAFSGINYIEESATLIATGFLTALLVLLLAGVVIFAMRNVILKRLFGIAEVQIEQMATPLANVADRAIARDPAGATSAARELAAMALAKYAWITTRRWIVTSLTALIAAMAALAGTALLFKQNQLIETQSGLLTEQNTRISEQTALLEQQVQLAEADRNAQIAAGITQIGAELGAVVDRLAKEYEAGVGEPLKNDFNVTAMNDLPRALVLRIVSTSQAAKPYRFLDLAIQSASNEEKARVAFQRRRAEMPNTYARIANVSGWVEPSDDVQLIDRPASPERGQLLLTLFAAGMRSLEPLNHVGLDLSFALMINANVINFTVQGGILNHADFTGSHIVESDFGGAALENARFVRCVIRKSSFAQLTAERVRPPYTAAMAPDMSTRATGIDFRSAFIVESDFTRAQLVTANFDGALLLKTNLSEASLGLSTFRDAILVAPVLKGVDLKSADFDGAIVFGNDVLANLATQAAPGRFVPDRFVAEPVTRDVIMNIPIVLRNLTLDDIDQATSSAPAWRIKRVKPFDDGDPPPSAGSSAPALPAEQ